MVKWYFAKWNNKKRFPHMLEKTKSQNQTKPKPKRRKGEKTRHYVLCSVQCDVFIYWFEHFVSLSDGIYRNQHRYTCWYIFILMSITKRWTKVRHKCSITMSKCTANDNSAHQSTSNRILVPLQRFTVNWKHITVGWPTHVCHATKWFQCV